MIQKCVFFEIRKPMIKAVMPLKNVDLKNIHILSMLLDHARTIWANQCVDSDMQVLILKGKKSRAKFLKHIFYRVKLKKGIPQISYKKRTYLLICFFISLSNTIQEVFCRVYTLTWSCNHTNYTPVFQVPGVALVINAGTRIHE